MRGRTYDEERFSVNLARLRKGGETYEVVIEPDLAVKYARGKNIDISDVLKAEKIWADAKKGELASETHMQSLFGTTDPLEVADIILKKGDIQLTQEQREKMRKAKYNTVVNIIHMNAINPQTETVHPEQRIRRAMDEAGVRVDEFKSAQEQVQEIVTKLRPIIPIKFATFIVDVHLPATYAAKLYGAVQQYGNVEKEEWLSDGSLAASVEVPAGRYDELVDELSSKTHGDVEITKREKT